MKGDDVLRDAARDVGEILSDDRTLPREVLGVEVARVTHTWWVDDLHGSRYYCEAKTIDGRTVTMLRADDGWKPMIVV